MLKTKVKILIVFCLLIFNSTALAKSPSELIVEIVDKASSILSSNLSDDEKITQLNYIAENNVDIKGIGFYTLGKFRKNISAEEQDRYAELFRKYFLKSFSSRLVTYTDPKINVISEKVVNEKYTIVNSVLVATEKRPEVKIDWRIYTKNPDKPLIRDLIVEGLSLARTQKEEFASILNSNNNDVNVLLNKLQEFISN